MDFLLTSEFWKAQGAFVMSAPYVIIPLLLIAGFLGFKIKSMLVSSRIDTLTAEKNFLETQLKEAREGGAAVTKAVDALKTQVTELEKRISEHAQPEELKKLLETVTVTATQASTANTAQQFILKAEPGSLKLTGGSVKFKLTPNSDS